jgi:hypothetical protein
MMALTIWVDSSASSASGAKCSCGNCGGTFPAADWRMSLDAEGTQEENRIFGVWAGVPKPEVFDIAGGSNT